MIDNYPNFSAINKNSKPEISRITSRYDPYSDFDFTSLFCWDVNESSGVSLLNDNLIIRLPDYISGKPVYSILGINDLDRSIETLLKDHKKLELVPEDVIKHLDRSGKYTIQEDRDSFDYVFSLEDLADLNGSKHRTRRKNINRFTRNFESTSIDVLKNTDSKHIEEIKELFCRWAVEQDKTPAVIYPESQAIARAIDNIELFNLYLIEIVVDGKLAGFSINEVLNNDWAICHFQKSLLTYKHIDVYLSREVASFLMKLGCKWVNWEQDLGIQGMRDMKLSYKPAHFLKKYTLEKKVS